jgi:NADH:ubiquinone oxidoreductase subunit 2 (subunit N)
LLVRESSIKYFLVQSLARILIFFGGALIFILLINSWLSQNLIFIRLTIKIGLFPIHFWVIPVLRGLWYPQIGVILIPLKAAPLALINYVELNSILINILYFIAVISILGGGLIGNNSSNIRGIVSASSIAHTG